MRDLQQQVDAEVKQKLNLESDLNMMRERVVALEKDLEEVSSRNSQLQQANSALQTQAAARTGKSHANGSLLAHCTSQTITSRVVHCSLYDCTSLMFI